MERKTSDEVKRRLMEQYGGLFDGDAGREHTVENDAFDRAVFEELVDESPALDSLVRQGESVFSPFKSLMQDVFSSLYKYNIIFFDNSEIRHSHLQNRRFMEEIIRRKEYAELRNFTIMEEVPSAIGAMGLAEALLKQLQNSLSESVNDLAEAEREMRDNLDALESAEELLDRVEEEEQQRLLEKQLREAVEEMEEGSRQFRESLEKMEEMSREGERSMHRALDEGFDKTLDDVKETSEIVEGWGEHAGEAARLSLNQRMALAERLKSSDKLKKLAKMVGRFKRLALSEQKRRIKYRYEEVYDIFQGNELAHLIPSELLGIRHPVLHKDFKRRFMEGKLLQYNLKGPDDRGKGALVVCIDGSYSMEGEKEMWSKAVSLALLDVAKRQRRNFRAIHFGSKKDPLKTIEFAKNMREDERVMRMEELAEFFLGGGTDFEKPLTAAMDSLDEDQKQNGDIVFITDGDCAVSPKWLRNFMETKKKLEVQVYSILVDMGINTTATVKEFSDKITTVSRLTSDEVKELFYSI